MRIGDESGRARAEAIDPALLVADPVRTPQEGSEWRAAWWRFRHHLLAMIGLGFLVLMFLACFVGAQFAPNPNTQQLLEPNAGVSQFRENTVRVVIPRGASEASSG